MSDTIGAGLSSLGNVAPSWLGGGSGGFLSNAGNYMSGTTPGAYTGAGIPSNLGDVSSGTFSGDLTSPPGATVATGPYPSTAPTISAPDPSAVGSSSAGTGGFAGPPSPVAANYYTDPRNTGTGTPGGDPSVAFSDPTIQQSMASRVAQALFGTPADPNDPKSKATPGILAGLSTGGTDLLKYLQQRQLMDPKALAAAQSQLFKAQAAKLRKSILPQVTAQGQETGQINAPYLMNQAYTTAMAPILAKMQEDAMTQWLEANRLTGGLYPSSSEQSALGGLVQPGIYGGGSGGSSD